MAVPLKTGHVKRVANSF